jgi:predicted RNA-binding Zn ribbon-like protein
MAPATTRPVLRYDDGGWIEAIGGHPALDLVNTVSWRLDPSRTVERIPNAAELVRWAEFVGLVDHGQATDAAAAEVRILRERLYRIARPLAIGAEPAAKDVDAIRVVLVGALGRAQIESLMPLELTAADLVDRLALEAWRLLEREDVGRLRECQADYCGWLFLDRTKNASRRWCSSADCGNRARARRHYARRTAEGA